MSSLASCSARTSSSSRRVLLALAICARELCVVEHGRESACRRARPRLQTHHVLRHFCCDKCGGVAWQARARFVRARRGNTHSTARAVRKSGGTARRSTHTQLDNGNSTERVRLCYRARCPDAVTCGESRQCVCACCSICALLCALCTLRWRSRAAGTSGDQRLRRVGSASRSGEEESELASRVLHTHLGDLPSPAAGQPLASSHAALLLVRWCCCCRRVPAARARCVRLPRSSRSKKKTRPPSPAPPLLSLPLLLRVQRLLRRLPDARLGG